MSAFAAWKASHDFVKLKPGLLSARLNIAWRAKIPKGTSGTTGFASRTLTLLNPPGSTASEEVARSSILSDVAFED